MARILSISYDDTLLFTRELILRNAGHDVVSCLGYQEAMGECARGSYDLLVIGHSIAQQDKLAIIDNFRRENAAAVVIALTRAGEPPLSAVDRYVMPGDPEQLLRDVQLVLQGLNGNRT